MSCHRVMSSDPSPACSSETPNPAFANVTVEVTNKPGPESLLILEKPAPQITQTTPSPRNRKANVKKLTPLEHAIAEGILPKYNDQSVANFKIAALRDLQKPEKIEVTVHKTFPLFIFAGVCIIIGTAIGRSLMADFFVPSISLISCGFGILIVIRGMVGQTIKIASEEPTKNPQAKWETYELKDYLEYVKHREQHPCNWDNVPKIPEDGQRLIDKVLEIEPRGKILVHRLFEDPLLEVVVFHPLIPEIKIESHFFYHWDEPLFSAGPCPFDG